MSLSPPGWTPIWLRCRVCKHCWDDWQPVRVPLLTWVAHVRAYRCPKCSANSGDIFLRDKPLDDTP